MLGESTVRLVRGSLEKPGGLVRVCEVRVRDPENLEMSCLVSLCQEHHEPGNPRPWAWSIISSRPLLRCRGLESSVQYPRPAGRLFPPRYDRNTLLCHPSLR